MLITRDDRRSQLATFKAGVKYLSEGTPIMAFPEGQRSASGRLAPFKGGVFSMAVKAKVSVRKRHERQATREGACTANTIANIVLTP